MTSKLDSPLTPRDYLDWHLHWIKTNLSIFLENHPASTPEKICEELRIARDQFDRICGELNTILRHGWLDEYKETPKYKEVVELIRKAEELARTRYVMIQRDELEQFKKRLRNLRLP